MTSSKRLLSFLIVVLTGFSSFGLAQQATVGAPTQQENQLPRNRSQQEPVSTSDTPDPRSKTTTTAQNQPAPVKKARQAELMEFVKQHHPEIRPLFKTLKKSRPANYASQIRTLDREVRKLQNLEKRSPERYKTSLAMWIAQSKTKLFSAQLAVKSSDSERQKLRKQIRNLIKEHSNLRIESLNFEIQSAEQRLKKLRTQLSSLESNRDSHLDRQMKSIDQTADRIRSNRKKKSDSKSKNRSGKQSDKGPVTGDPPKTIR